MQSPEITGDKYVNAFVHYVRTHDYPRLGALDDDELRFECDKDNITCCKLDIFFDEDYKIVLRDFVYQYHPVTKFENGAYVRVSNGVDSWYTLMFDGYFYEFSGGLDNERAA